MKITGWILTTIGILSAFVAYDKGDSLVGPSFCIALGIFLRYRARLKSKEKKKRIATEAKKTAAVSEEKLDNLINQGEDVPVESLPHQQLESVEDVRSQLTLQQREAAICLISFFGGYNDNMDDRVSIMLFKQAAYFLGIPDSPLVLSRIMAKYTDADVLVDIVCTIKSIKVKEFLLLTCYDLIKSTDKSEAYDMLFHIAKDMGYEEMQLQQLIRLYQ